MNKSEEIAELAKSLSKVQGEIHNAFKDKAGYGYKYVDLASILDITRPLLSKYGLSVTQLCGSANEVASVETVLMHESGQWISATIQMGIERGKGMSSAQAVGSVITYARRYALAAIVGIAQTDDDAGLRGSIEPELVALSPHQRLRKTISELGLGADNVVNALARYECTKLSELPEDKFDEFLSLVKAKTL